MALALHRLRFHHRQSLRPNDLRLKAASVAFSTVRFNKLKRAPALRAGPHPALYASETMNTQPSEALPPPDAPKEISQPEPFSERIAAVRARRNPLLEAARPLLRVLMDVPEHLDTDATLALRSLFEQEVRINVTASDGMTVEIVEKVTKAINGSVSGLKNSRCHSFRICSVVREAI
ncbi:hypothetical protein BDI4_1120029 [Burkholderia diffusa]|uniref:hypothetical protein n=1 Tax=Burkholderia diffusa TaxID=488732 RepID=UPI001CAC741B|nr:hypothetical protein BDI4_1120029 [Burkholderia diffusa]